MKKIVFMACLMAISMVMACGNKTEANISTNDSDSVLVDSLDSVNVVLSDSTITNQ